MQLNVMFLSYLLHFINHMFFSFINLLGISLYLTEVLFDVIAFTFFLKISFLSAKTPIGYFLNLQKNTFSL